MTFRTCRRADLIEILVHCRRGDVHIAAGGVAPVGDLDFGGDDINSPRASAFWISCLKCLVALQLGCVINSQNAGTSVSGWREEFGNDQEQPGLRSASSTPSRLCWL